MFMILLLLLTVFAYPVFSEPNYNNVLNKYSEKDGVMYVAEMAVKTADNKRCPFVIIDKKNTKIYLFNSEGLLIGEAPVLIGMAMGDELSPEIACLPLSMIKPSKRITPAGRYIGEIGKDTHGNEVLWVDFNGNLAIHPVIEVPKQHRAERLKSETIEDNKISWGCINVPKIFFKDYMIKNFARTKGMVYILPEIKSIKECSWFQ